LYSIKPLPTGQAERRLIKYRVNRGQEFVIGGYLPGPHGFDSLIVGYNDGDKLMYVARTRNGFVPASRRQVFSKLKHLVTPERPFVNLPETRDHDLVGNSTLRK
jgi:ATP-dependent DNA ligase